MIISKGLPTVPAYALPTEAEIPASRAQWTLQRDRAALLVHDMQRYFMRRATSPWSSTATAPSSAATSKR
jgi:isochorismate hydrolase